MPTLHRLSSLSGNADADFDLNLGSEPPSDILKVSPDSTPRQELGPRELDAWTRAGIALTTDLPTRPRDWHSDSFSEKQKQHPRMKKEVDRDCGICFELARAGCRTPCCRTLFCMEHIIDWLNGPASEGKCPSCGTACIVQNSVVTLAAAPHPPPQPPHTSSYAPSQLLHRHFSGPHETTVDVNPISD
ncbi:hypothetical protein D9757_008890 [Collybiopsis confluens]|uniref:RING-type domain-containing protein n=1 Tax=Collybiopsis confluens TaxID=2823264 RepID=A0A8H5H5J8_9AGAR|nr:hypothetical protein D9757_008890 [Collybiopsis confluens]